MNNSLEITDIALVDYRDRGFMEWSRRMKRAFKGTRVRDPHPADYQRMLASLEQCVRHVLAKSAILSDARVLRFCSTRVHGSKRLQYREIDAVTLLAGSPACAIEVKFRENGQAAFKAVGQLEQSLAILRRVWPAANGLLFTLWMTPVFGGEGRAPECLNDISSVQTFLGQQPQSAFASYCLDGARFLELAASAGLWSPAQTSNLCALRRAALNPLSTLEQRPREGGSFNSLGNLFDNLFPDGSSK